MNNHNNQWSGPVRGGRPPSGDAATTAFSAATVSSTERIPTATPGQSYETAPPPIVLRRARPAVFIAPQPEQGHLVSRDIGLGRGLSKQPELSRNRKIAGNLPSWDPLPPGEIRVVARRPTGGS